MIRQIHSFRCYGAPTGLIRTYGTHSCFGFTTAGLHPRLLNEPCLTALNPGIVISFPDNNNECQDTLTHCPKYWTVNKQSTLTFFVISWLTIKCFPINRYVSQVITCFHHKRFRTMSSMNNHIEYRALVAEESDSGFTQQVKTLSTASLPENDLLIRVHYSSLNYKDALSATGNRAVTKNYPFTPGIDAAGEVVSSSDSRFSPGDQVIVTSYDLGMNTPGGFGEYISIPAGWALHLPDGLSLKESMMIGTSGLTAAIGVEKIMTGGVNPGSGKVLVTGATGAVGSFAVALLSHLGYPVTAATGKTDEAGFLEKLGAQEILHRDEITNVENRPLLASKWHAALDTVGGTMLDAVLRQTAHNGVVACCGNVLGGELNTSIYPFILRGVSLMGIDSGIALMEDRLRVWSKLAGPWKPGTMQYLFREADLGGLPGEIYRILKGGQTGKVLISLRD
jgi:acrylyl-CoA reductase (NADPH)